jgi:hypothetical protein
MIIMLNKFGTLLMSRQAGKEALAAFQPDLRLVKPDEKVTVDFLEQTGREKLGGLKIGDGL